MYCLEGVVNFFAFGLDFKLFVGIKGRALVVGFAAGEIEKVSVYWLINTDDWYQAFVVELAPFEPGPAEKH